MFCFDSAELRVSLLEEWFVEKVAACGTLRKKQKYAKDCLINMSPDDDYCPFKLSNLTFVCYSDFLTQRKARKGKHRGKMMSLGNASYEQAQSALKHLFRMSKYAMLVEYFDSLKQFTKGIRQHVADKKALEGDVSISGKKKMGFDVYKKICELFMNEEGEEFIFAHAFLTLEWNLMARSENVVHAHILHVSWDVNCLVFCFIKSKGDQMGRNHDQEWHVYANPHNPKICPVLALACYIFANPGIFCVSTDEEEDQPEDEYKGEHKGHLFPGGNQYDCFMDHLHRIIGKYLAKFFCIGYLSW